MDPKNIRWEDPPTTSPTSPEVECPHCGTLNDASRTRCRNCQLPMDGALVPFAFPETGQRVRTVVIDGDPWFVLADVAKILGYRDAEHAGRLCRDAQLNTLPQGIAAELGQRGGRLPKIVTEGGLYRLVMRSNVALAEPFQDWVTDEVLPAIRRTGRYEVEPSRHLPQSYAEALRELADTVEQRDAERAGRLIAERKVVELAPKAAQADHHRSADGCKAIGDFANELKSWAAQHHPGVRILHKDVWDFLGEIDLIIRGNTIRHNQPTAFATDRDFVRTKNSSYEDSNGVTHATSTPRLTPAGEGWAWDRAVRRIETFGTLRPQRAIEGGV